MSVGTLSPKEFITALQKERNLCLEDRQAYRSDIKEQSRIDHLLALFQQEIRAYEQPEEVPGPISEDEKPKTVVAMLGDVHYGLSFANSAGIYSPTLAIKRMSQYCDRLIEESDNAQEVIVVLLGDLISGNIHKSIQVENRVNVVEQVVHVSEAIAHFIKRLADCYPIVRVVSVSGNHSRIEDEALAAPRGEKLDALVPWYCKTKLAAYENVAFTENVDDSIAAFEACGKTFVAVHGDYDKDIGRSVQHISRLLKKHIDVMLYGHLHVPNMDLDDVFCFRNGSVCGSGDEYTVKKRMFSPPIQTYLVYRDNELHSVVPVVLK